MSLLVPWALALGLALIPALILLYLLKVRRRDYEVGSTYLWTHLLRDLAAHEPWQKLHWSVLLTAQLIVLTLLIAALARPFVPSTAEESIHAILLLDASASMQMTDVQPSRFEAAREAARQTLRDLPEGSIATLITVKGRPEVLVAQSQDRSALQRALDSVAVSGGGADVRQAMLLASALNTNRKRARLYLFSDGALAEAEELDPQGLEVTLVPVGTSAENRAISTLSARPDPHNTRRYQVFARVRNYGTQPVRDSLTLYADGGLADSREVDLPPGQAREFVFSDLPVGARTVEAKLGAPDLLPLDDQAYAVLDVRKPAQVLLVTTGNVYLEKVLTLIPNAEMFRTAPRRYFTIDSDRYDLVIFDNFVPDVLPRGNLLFVNPSDSTIFTVEGEVRRPRVRSWERDEPLLQFVDPRELAIARAQRLAMPTWAHSVMHTDDSSLLMVGEREGQRIVVLPFDLRQSNLPLLPAFPILMLNIFGYLEPLGQVDTRDLRPGDSVTIQPLAQTEEVLVRRPDGSTVSLKAAGQPLRFDQTVLPGIYSATQRVQTAAISQDVFAVNPSNEHESDVRPRELRLVGQPPAEAREADMVSVQREVWFWLLPAALLVLLFEWWWFHRRT